MNVAEARAALYSAHDDIGLYRVAGLALADEVDRLEAQLERTRSELAEATVRLAEWDRMNTVLAAVLPSLEQQMTPERARCNCGFGGFHDDANPRCQRNAEPSREAGL